MHSSSASAGMPPGRRSRAPPLVSARIVDSTPTSHGPASTTAAIRPDSPATTCSALVGLTRPEGFAEGAATGPPNARRSSRATGWAGKRIATVGKSAVTNGDKPVGSRSGRTKVSGPGQKAEATRSARGSKTASCLAASISATCTINGLKRGRSLASNIPATA